MRKNSRSTLNCAGGSAVAIFATSRQARTRGDAHYLIAKDAKN